MKKYLFFFIFFTLFLKADPIPLSPVYPEDSLPYSIQITQASFGLPSGLQSFAFGIYKHYWVMVAGRTNGLHTFDQVENFPPRFQNTRVFVIDSRTGRSYSRSLFEAGITQEMIDQLSVTASEHFYKGKKLYIVGGYGINTATGQMETKSTFTKISMPKLINWVFGKRDTLKGAIRQAADPILQVTGGAMFQFSDYYPFLLVMGQNFVGSYTEGSNGIYTNQIRSFKIKNQGSSGLKLVSKKYWPASPDYRRRDLNVVPVIIDGKAKYMVLGGVFTLDDGVWTVPVTVSASGSSFEPDPNAPETFKQAMNQYRCPAFGLYSEDLNNMYVLLPGGISLGYFENGIFQTDPEIPFINQVTTVKISQSGFMKQYLMNGEYPVIISQVVNPGNPFLFGAEARFFIKEGISTYSNGVIKFDKLKGPTIVGYIVGGIISTLPNTNAQQVETTSSPYIFAVTIIPR